MWCRVAAVVVTAAWTPPAVPPAPGLAAPPRAPGLARGGRASRLLMTSARQEDSALRANALLMQRAVQTQIHYFRDFKNDFAKNWLVRYGARMGTAALFQNAEGGGGSILHHHDSMGGVTWDAYMRGMMDAPEETHEVHVVWGNQVGGGSPENPYLQKRDKVTKYNDTIVPSRIAAQLLSIRVMLSEELVEDLKLIGDDNVELRRHHDEIVRNLVDDEAANRHAIRPHDWDQKRQTSPSPLRQANYDLLKNALTEQAFQLLLHELDRDTLQRHSYEWLQAFGRTHAARLRQPDAGWHVASELLGEMMAQPVAVSTSPGGNARFLDPLALADQLMELRLEIADEWADALLLTPSNHMDLQVEEAREQLQLRGFGQAWDR